MIIHIDILMQVFCVLYFFLHLTHIFCFSTGLMFVPRGVNLSKLVVAERAVATGCKKKCANFIYSNKVIVQMTALFIV